jgi:hypothetical protein
MGLHTVDVASHQANPAGLAIQDHHHNDVSAKVSFRLPMSRTIANYTTLEMVVVRAPKKVRIAILRSRMLALLLGIFLDEYKLLSGIRKSRFRYVF